LTPPSITCPTCGRTSYNANDIREEYCGHCHQFHRDMVIIREATNEEQLAALATASAAFGEWSEDVCAVCGEHLGWGVKALHLGMCEDCAAKATH
jgi:hypothetical protein